MARPTSWRRPISSSSTPATSARRRPRRSIPSSGACAISRRSAQANGQETKVVVAGCVAQAEGIGDPAPRALRRRGGGAAELSPPARPAAAPEGRRRHRIPHRGQVRSPAEADPLADRLARGVGVPDHPGGLRQVLHLLRRALYARHGGLPSGFAPRRGGDPAGGGGRARTQPDRPERQCVARRGTGRIDLVPEPAALSPGRDPRHRPASLHHVASARHG